MPPIGTTLREARMRRGIDIAEVESATKIRAKYLRALENEEFDLLPGSTFVRTFLRTYAEYLGLDPQLLVEEYRASHEPHSIENEMQHFAPQSPRDRGRRYRPGPPGRGAVAAALVGLLVVFFLILGLTGEEDDQPPTDRAGERDRDRRQRGGGPRRRPRRPAQPRQVSLRVTPSEATYLCVDDGGGRVLFEGTLVAPRSFRRQRLRINLGRSSARVRVNGRAVPLPAGPVAVGYDFTPTRRRALAPGERPCV